MNSKKCTPIEITINGNIICNTGQNRHEEENRNPNNERKFLSADDVKLSFQLSREGTMTYWVASVLSGDCSSKVTKVIAKSVSGNAQTVTFLYKA